MNSSIQSGKQEILTGFAEMLSYVRGLSGIDHDLWLTPMQPGKWSVAETIAHLVFWDRFILEERMPIMHAGAILPKAEIDLEAFNGEAARYAREEASQETVIQEFCLDREKILDEIAKRSEKEVAAVMYTSSQKETSIYLYFKGMIEHDLHHLAPIKQFLSINPNELDS
ncbi:DinB family protein [Brevibacillus ginsengisoli]|uniref:DinB family protein n=1 Tax=Brevibacillus ginsengisoli TaxID=363854 RepID=UPI003CEE92C1